MDLADYDLTDIAWSDYSAAGDGSVKAWMDGTELYIGGYGKIIAGESLSYAFEDGYKIDSITGIEMLDTSAVTDMSYMFYYCGYNSGEFKLNLGDNFDTSNVTNMSHMFDSCGYYSTTSRLIWETTLTHPMLEVCYICSSPVATNLRNSTGSGKTV